MGRGFDELKKGPSMKRLAARCILALASLLLLSPASYGQIFRAYLSVAGNDSNPCTAAFPCRLLPAALNAVASGGEIWMLDSANFNAGTVTISKNVTILAIPGQVGSIVAAGGAAAIATASNAVVKLRNVVIATNAVNPGADGIDIASGTSVSIEDSVIDIAGGWDAVYIPSGGTFSATGTIFRGPAPGLGNAIVGTGNAVADVANSRFYNWSRGFYMNNPNTGTLSAAGVTNCVFSHVSVGVYLVGGSATANARANVTGSTFIHGDYGVAVLSSGGSAIATVDSSMFGNLASTALYNLGGTGAVLESAGTNVVRNNSTNTAGTITTVPRI